MRPWLNRKSPNLPRPKRLRKKKPLRKWKPLRKPTKRKRKQTEPESEEKEWIEAVCILHEIPRPFLWYIKKKVESGKGKVERVNTFFWAGPGKRSRSLTQNPKPKTQN
jgi:hypothetical protein